VRYLVGIGTYLSGDDAIGLRVAEAIAAEGLDCGFTAIELSGSLLDLVHYLGEGVERVLIVDCARMGLEPGAYAFFTPGAAETRKSLAGFSTHEGDLMKVLALAAALGAPMPEITVLGIEPADVTPRAELSLALEGRLGEYVAMAVESLTEEADRL
jgi:hydrogenase maturation protease